MLGWLAAYAEVELLIKVGEYKAGSDPQTDLAIARNRPVNDFLRQRTDEVSSFAETEARMAEVSR